MHRLNLTFLLVLLFTSFAYGESLTDSNLISRLLKYKNYTFNSNNIDISEHRQNLIDFNKPCWKEINSHNLKILNDLGYSSEHLSSNAVILIYKIASQKYLILSSPKYLFTDQFKIKIDNEDILLEASIIDINTKKLHPQKQFGFISHKILAQNLSESFIFDHNVSIASIINNSGKNIYRKTLQVETN